MNLNDAEAEALNFKLSKVHPDGVIDRFRRSSARCVLEDKDWWRHDLKAMWNRRELFKDMKLLVG